MKHRIFSHFQDYLIQYISHQYLDLLYCNSSQYILSTYNSEHNNNNNNVMLSITMSIIQSKKKDCIFYDCHQEDLIEIEIEIEISLLTKSGLQFI
jgi:hypothetical protein